MFWNKWFEKHDSAKAQKPKLKPPADLPRPVGQYLVVKLQQDPDWVWELKAVVTPVDGGKRSLRRFRVYDPVLAAKQWVKVLNYHSLDDYPEFILYEGEYDKDTNAVSLFTVEAAKAA